MGGHISHEAKQSSLQLRFVKSFQRQLLSMPILHVLQLVQSELYLQIVLGQYFYYSFTTFVINIFVFLDKKSENLFGHTPFFILLMNFANLCYRIVSEFFFSPVLSHDCVTTGASSVVPAFCSTYRNKLRGSPIFLSRNLIFSLLQRLLVLSCMKS